MRAPLDPKLRSLLRLEGLSMALVGATGAWVCAATGWQIAITALAPDLTILAYAWGPRFGARLYNVAHSYALPLLLTALGLLLTPSVLPIAALWLAHIGVDRALGYGLKSEAGFGVTHLGPIGRDR